MLFCSPSSPLHNRLVTELQTIDSCIEVVTAELAALCCALQQQMKTVSLSVISALETTLTCQLWNVQNGVFSFILFSFIKTQGWPHHGRTFFIYLCSLSF